jgi:hypothetical protein
MRINLILFLFCTVLGVFLWVTLSGALLAFGLLGLLAFIIMTLGYPDKAVLFFLSAREIKSNDEPLLFEAASTEAYKLRVQAPSLYFYDGALERAFVLQNRKHISLVLSKRLMLVSASQDLGPICFELLLQAKKAIAPKRTKVMFLLGLISWFVHSVMDLFLKLFRRKEVNEASDMVLNYLLHPWLDLLFRLTMGQGYFRKLKHYLEDYPREFEQLKFTAMKWERPSALYSLPSRKMIELSSVSKNRRFQNMLAIEILPHEWDILFQEGSKGA